ncbi:MAG TPA: O-antigen ligase family protein [Ktedonosporobacter sp.]|nr:O-antigen ligase family protein [Ktedonosporobacter sp.]
MAIHSVVEQLEQISDGSWFKRVSANIRGYAHWVNLIGLLGGMLAIFCLLALPASQYWNIRLPLYLVVAIWVIVRPQAALYLLPIAVPWGSLDSINISSASVNSADILVFLLAASWLMSITLRPIIAPGIANNGPLDRAKFAVPGYLVLATVLLLLTMLLSMSGAFSITSSLKELVKWLEVLIILLLGGQYLRTRRQIWTLVAIICLAALSQAALGYIQYFFDLGPNSFVRDATLRVYGTFNQPNPFAGYINMTLPVALALTLLAGNWKTRILAGLTSALLAPMIVPPIWLTQSKGGSIAFAAALLCIIVVGMPRLRKLIAIGAVAALGLVGAYLGGFIPDRFTAPLLKVVGLTDISFTTPSPQDFATAERIAHWIAGIRMFVNHSLTGVGIGNYAEAYPQYFVTIFVNPLGHAHNYYINMAAEAGIFGLLAFFLFLLALFVAGGRSYRAVNKRYLQVKESRTRPQPGRTETQPSQGLLNLLTNDRALAIGLLASLIAVCVHNLVDDLYVHSMASLFALLLVMLIRLEKIVPQQQAFSDTGCKERTTDITLPGELPLN